MSKTVCITFATAKNLDFLAQKLKKSKQFILEQAVELMLRELFIKEANDAYARLKQNPDAWKEIKDEYEEWDVTL